MVEGQFLVFSSEFLIKENRSAEPSGLAEGDDSPAFF